MIYIPFKSIHKLLFPRLWHKWPHFGNQQVLTLKLRRAWEAAGAVGRTWIRSTAVRNWKVVVYGTLYNFPIEYFSGIIRLNSHFVIFSISLGITIPADELIFWRGVGIPPTGVLWSNMPVEALSNLASQPGCPRWLNSCMSASCLGWWQMGPPTSAIQHVTHPGWLIFKGVILPSPSYYSAEMSTTHTDIQLIWLHPTLMFNWDDCNTCHPNTNQPVHWDRLRVFFEWSTSIIIPVGQTVDHIRSVISLVISSIPWYYLDVYLIIGADIISITSNNGNIYSCDVSMHTHTQTHIIYNGMWVYVDL